MSGNIFGSLIDSVKEVFSNPQVLAQGVKDGNIARTGNTEYFIDGKDSFHNMKDAEAASGRWQNMLNNAVQNQTSQYQLTKPNLGYNPSQNNQLVNLKFEKGGEICKICAGKKMQDGGKSDPIKNFKKKKDVAKQTYQRNPYTRGKSAKEIAEMQRRNRQEASAGKGENDANVAPWNYKKKKMK